MAAYFGLLDLAQLRSGETVLVSAAADAAGAMAGQIAMLKGARAIGIAGDREKCDWVTRHARLSACINQAAENVSVRLKALAPRGVDIYFDNTGRELLDTIVAGRHLAAGGRIVQNTVKAGDPDAILARGGYLPGNGGRAGAACQGARLRASARGISARRDRLAWRGAASPPRSTSSRDSPMLRRTCCSRCRTANFGRSLVRV